MAWTTPRTWSDNEVVTAAIMNTVRDNLTDLDSRIGSNVTHKAYAATLLNASNTASEVTVVTATVADAVADGDLLAVDMVYTLLQNTGGNDTLRMDFLYGGVEATIFPTATAIASDASTTYSAMRILCGREGSDAYVGIVTGGSSNAFGGATRGLADGFGATLSSPTFTASQTLSVKVTLGTASANYVFSPKYAMVSYLGA